MNDFIKSFIEKKQNLLTPKQAAELLTIGEDTLAIWRCTKRYELPYIKMGRLIRYKVSYIEDFIKKRTIDR